MSNTIITDFIVVGSGIAGLWFSYRVLNSGQVCILTKKENTESNTNYAQGGIAAALGIDDTPEIHYQDTLKNGQGLARPEIVRMVCEMGPRLVNELYEVGINFSTYYNSKGIKRFDLGKEGGHSRARIVHAKDYTGREIETGLIRLLKERCVFYEHFLVFDLIIDKTNRCIGVEAVDTKTGKVYCFLGKAMVLATGGIGQIYLHTTNPPIATGDGIAIAYKNGALVSNMEFIQFHPTALYGKKIDNRYFLISEAVRGEGGILRTIDGNTFMENYHEKGCLAPRDIVARAIDNEMKKRVANYVLLDVTHLDPERIKLRFPNIYNTCLQLGYDITKEPIPVVPAAHYICGGIEINQWGETNIPGLLAIGECAHSGLHGANRLASNSLLEALVFAEQAARRVKETACKHEIQYQKIICNNNKRIEIQKNPKVKILIDKLQKIMWNGAGIVRSNNRIDNALAELAEIAKHAKKIQPLSIDLIELNNMITVGYLVLKSAFLRNESRGLHYKEDYPYIDNEHFLKDTVLQKSKDDEQYLPNY
ncbi:MAG: L-aspartate oxidase [candidate division WOR-3 bacterium]